jgi:hypothetical protein
MAERALHLLKSYIEYEDNPNSQEFLAIVNAKYHHTISLANFHEYVSIFREYIVENGKVYTDGNVMLDDFERKICETVCEFSNVTCVPPDHIFRGMYLSDLPEQLEKAQRYVREYLGK